MLLQPALHGVLQEPALVLQGLLTEPSSGNWHPAEQLSTASPQPATATEFRVRWGLLSADGEDNPDGLDQAAVEPPGPEDMDHPGTRATVDSDALTGVAESNEEVAPTAHQDAANAASQHSAQHRWEHISALTDLPRDSDAADASEDALPVLQSEERSASLADARPRAAPEHAAEALPDAIAIDAGSVTGSSAADIDEQPEDADHLPVDSFAAVAEDDAADAEGDEVADHAVPEEHEKPPLTGKAAKAFERRSTLLGSAVECLSAPCCQVRHLHSIASQNPCVLSQCC